MRVGATVAGQWAGRVRECERKRELESVSEGEGICREKGNSALYIKKTVYLFFGV